MSYSFTIVAATGAEAKDRVALELKAVVDAQPIHAIDWAHAADAANGLIDLLRDDETQAVSVSVNGSCFAPGEDGLSTASLSVSASLVAKEE
jgi:hypothetical protein